MQSAVGMLRDQNEDSCRSTKRIEILLGFLSKEDDLKGAGSQGALLKVPVGSWVCRRAELYCEE